MFDYFTLDGVNNTDPDFNTYNHAPFHRRDSGIKVQTGSIRRSLATKRPRSTC